MPKLQTVIHSFILFALLTQAHGTFASETSEINCPSVEQLSDFTYQEGAVSKYIKNDHQVVFDSEFQNMIDDDRLWILQIESMKAGSGDELQNIAQASLDKLVLVSPKPFLTESIMGIFEDSYEVPVCIYTSTEDDTITAFARYLDFGDHNGSDSDREEIKKRVIAKTSQKLHN